MGHSSSRIANKFAKSFHHHHHHHSSSRSDTSEEIDIDSAEGMAKALAKFKGKLPFVYRRRGSMFFDQEGALAHEFYEELPPKRRGGFCKMKKISKKFLIPQGDVEYSHPRLHVDFPVILYQG